jgi:hypothetical protein
MKWAGHGVAGGVLALAGLHCVAHENADFRDVALHLGANLHRICHGFSFSF